MLDKDWEYSKIEKIIKDDLEIEHVKKSLAKNYKQIKNLYLKLSCNGSTYPNVDQNEMYAWANRSNFYDAAFTQVTFSNCMVAANVRTDITKPIEASNGALLRFEFLETIVRIT
jgi:hypothetical protein